MSKSRKRLSWLCCELGRIKISNQTNPDSLGDNSPVLSEAEGFNTPQQHAQGNWKRFLPGLLISLISLAIIFYFADMERFISALRLADYRLVVAAFFLGLVWLFVRAIAWRTLLLEKAGLGQVFLSVNEGYLLNNLLPFRLGEIGRSFLLSRKAKLGFWEVFSTILIERTIDLGLASGLLLTTLPFVFIRVNSRVDADWALQAALGVGMVVILGFAVLYLLARNRNWALEQVRKLGVRWQIVQKITGRRLEAFFDGLEVLTDGRRFFQSMAWMILDWLIAVVQYYILLLAFVPEVEPLWAIFTLGIAALGLAAPSSPGGLGVFELSVVGALAVFGVDASTALAYAISAHLIQYLLTGIIGAYGLYKDGESLLGVYSSLRRIPQASPSSSGTSPGSVGASPGSSTADSKSPH